MDATPQNSSPDEWQSVCVRVLNDRFSAELAAAHLEAGGVLCWINADDNAGLMPAMSVGGVRLYVGSNQTEDARALLAAFLPIRPHHPIKIYDFFGEPLLDQPKLIIVIGIWMLFGLALGIQLRGLCIASFILHDGLGKLVFFCLAIIPPAISIYMLFGSVGNYLIQKRRAEDARRSAAEL